MYRPHVDSHTGGRCLLRGVSELPEGPSASGGVCSQGGICSGGGCLLLGGGDMHEADTPPLTESHKNNLAPTSLRVVNIRKWKFHLVAQCGSVRAMSYHRHHLWVPEVPTNLISLIRAVKIQVSPPHTTHRQIKYHSLSCHLFKLLVQKGKSIH